MKQNEIPYTSLKVIITTTYGCNLRCVYCYNERQTHEKFKFISIATVKQLFKITIPYYKEINYLWHGGEPMLLGIDFYREVLKLQSEINTFGTVITNSIQTNITLMTDEWADFLINNNIKVGSSFDGTTTNMTRKAADKILAGYEKYKEHSGHNGFICVVQKNNIDHLIDDYKWFKSKNINYSLNTYLQTEDNLNDPLYVDADILAEKLNELYDFWLLDRDCNINVSYFAMFLSYFLLGEKNICCYTSCVGRFCGIRNDGSIYGCNRDFPEHFCYGNVFDFYDLHEVFNSNGFKLLIDEAIQRRYWCKENCSAFSFCSGGCNSVALKNGHVYQVNGQYCEYLKAVLKHIEESVNYWKDKSSDEISTELNPKAAFFFYEKNRRNDDIQNHKDYHFDEI